MLQAILKGKIPSAHWRREDVVTSCVFESLSRLPVRLGLGPWLREAQNLDGQRLCVSDRELSDRTTLFWPRMKLGGEVVEPDVLIECGEHGPAIVVEAKYGAGPSGVPDLESTRLCGQLGRQWVAAHRRESNRVTSLVYLTAHWVMPSGEMAEMLDELEHDKRFAGDGGQGGFRRRLYWLNWRSLHGLLEDLAGARLRESDSRVIEELSEFVYRADLDTFRGIRTPRPIAGAGWRYGYSLARPRVASVEWRYES